MTGNQESANNHYQTRLETVSRPVNYYTILGVESSATLPEIRRAYRDLSKRYHPDTTSLPPDLATVKFRELNDAYGVLSNPERRVGYDQQLQYAYLNRYQPPASIPNYTPQPSRSAYLDPTDRPLSPGEVFALFMMGLALVGCLALAMLIAWLRGEPTMETISSATAILISHHLIL